MKRLLFIASLLLFGALGGCSSSVKVTAPAGEIDAGLIAVLPVNYPADVTREHGEYLRTAVISELESSGYLVLDEKLVSKACSTPQCPERNRLVKDYMVESFGELSVGSVARRNFVAGYFNEISGTFVLRSQNGAELASLQVDENEKGGLLFNTGQLLQAVKSQVEGTRKDGFYLLADKFARSLVGQLPATTTRQIDADAVAVSIGATEVSAVNPPFYKVCANATPRSIASLILGAQRSGLRETDSGRYCGVFPLGDLSASVRPQIEVRSPFGNSMRQDLDLASVTPVCSLAELVMISRDGGDSQISISCQQGDSRCMREFESCQISRVLVYRASSVSGPYEKVGEFSGERWTDRRAPADPSTTYQIVAVNRDGVKSRPVSARLSAGT